MVDETVAKLQKQVDDAASKNLDLENQLTTKNKTGSNCVEYYRLRRIPPIRYEVIMGR